MAPPPLSPNLLQSTYDVFISFRGEDTRPRFTDHLYAALRRKNIKTFIDYQLKRGDNISPTLLRAIEESNVSVVILSENYASSKWCLEELVKIIECNERYGQIVVPVFYKIDPADVRNQRGTYAVAFSKHWCNFKGNISKLQEWRNALQKIANLAGWDSSKFSHEAEFVETIVRDLKEKLDQILPLRYYTKHLVGIDQHINCVKSLLDSKSSVVRIIGIWGMGGIGKTTIAEAVYWNLSPQYEGSCYFLEKVREKWENGRKRSVLRNKLLSKLLGENIEIDTPNIGPSFITRRLKRKRVLLVLDDLNNSEQLEYLAGGGHWFAQGSIIIVTSRDLGVLNNVDGILIHEIKGMDFHLSLQLFCLVAFKQSHPPQNYTELSRKAVSYSSGNPLALNVLARSLSCKSEKEWDDALEKLRKISIQEIQDVLRWSYEELDLDAKSIFLDIACFFKGGDESQIRILLQGCGLSTVIGFRTLLDKCLMSISSDNTVLLHDLIQEMGLQIAQEQSIREAGKRSRLWDPDDIYHVFKHNTGSDAVEGIFLDASRIKEVYLSPDIFNKMYNLRFLSIRASYDEKSNVHLPYGLNTLSDKLIVLHWEQYPQKFLPSTYCPEKLIELNLSRSCIVKLWDGVENLDNLIRVDLSFCKYLIELPDLSNAARLEILNLNGCTRLTHVSSSIFNLNKLTTLDLSGCSSLQTIHNDSVSSSLQWINLKGCFSLTEFSAVSTNLDYLNLGGTAIKELPSSIEYLQKLTELVLDSCASLQNLPNGFSKLGCLESLCLSNCPELEKLFPEFDGLHSLRKIFLDNCLNLQSIPNSITASSLLSSLSLVGSNIENLPASIRDLPQLKSLVLKDCKKLWYLPQLPSSIQRLNATNCVSLRIVKTFTSSIALNDDSLVTENRDLLRTDQVGYLEEFIFYNCSNLNRTAMDNILDDALSRIQRAAYLSATLEVSEVDSSLVQLCIPGSQVPYWFSYQTKNNCLTFQHPVNSVNELKLLRFAFCLVLATSTCVNDSTYAPRIGCKCQFEADCGERQTIEYSSEPSFIEPLICFSDHVYIWYDNLFCRNLLFGIKSRYNGKTNNLCPELKFKFYCQIDGMDLVKMCGVLVLKKVLQRPDWLSKL